MGGAELAGESQPLLDQVDADERMRADDAAELQCHQPDNAQPVDGDRFTELDLRPAHAVQSDIAENAEGDFDVGQVIGQLLHAVLLAYADIAGLELGCHKPVRGMVAAAQYAVADGDLVDLAARGFNDADGGVAQPGRGKRGLLRGAGRTALADAIHLGAGANLGEVGAYK